MNRIFNLWKFNCKKNIILSSYKCLLSNYVKNKILMVIVYFYNIPTNILSLK